MNILIIKPQHETIKYFQPTKMATLVAPVVARPRSRRARLGPLVDRAFAPEGSTRTSRSTKGRLGDIVARLGGTSLRLDVLPT